MELCTPCDTDFQSYAPLILTIKPQGSDILVYAQNTGKHIIFIKRMILCLRWDPSPSRTLLYLREPDFVVGGERLEPATTQLKYQISAAQAVGAQVEAEYVEATGRAVSCANDLRRRRRVDRGR